MKICSICYSVAGKCVCECEPPRCTEFPCNFPPSAAQRKITRELKSQTIEISRTFLCTSTTPPPPRHETHWEQKKIPLNSMCLRALLLFCTRPNDGDGFEEKWEMILIPKKERVKWQRWRMSSIWHVLSRLIVIALWVCVLRYLLFCHLNDSPCVSVCVLEKFAVSVESSQESEKREENAIFKPPLEILLKWIKVMFKFRNDQNRMMDRLIDRLANKFYIACMSIPRERES